LDPEIIPEIEEMLDEKGKAWFIKHEQKYVDLGKYEYFMRNRSHYVIRAFTRQVFDEKDIALSGQITEELYVRGLTNPENVSKNFISAIASACVTRKVVLAFDKKIRNRKALGFLKELRELKRDERFKKLFQNLIIITENTEELPHALGQYTQEPNVQAFMFTQAGAMAVLKDIAAEENVQAVYIDDTKLPDDNYYPLAEIVLLTLAEYLTMDTILDNLAERLDKLGIEKDMVNLDVSSIKRDEAGALIFSLVPNIKEYDTDERASRSARLRSFLHAA